MRKRDRVRKARSGRAPRALFGGADRSDSEDSDGPRRQRRRAAEQAAMGDTPIDVDTLVDEPLPGGAGVARDSLKSDAVVKQVTAKFRRFLTSFMHQGVRVYLERIKAMCASNRESLEVDYQHLLHARYVLAFVHDCLFQSVCACNFFISFLDCLLLTLLCFAATTTRTYSRTSACGCWRRRRRCWPYSTWLPCRWCSPSSKTITTSR